jgi:hypothetical protein
LLQVLVSGEEGVLYRILSVFHIAENPVGEAIESWQTM